MVRHESCIDKVRIAEGEHPQDIKERPLIEPLQITKENRDGKEPDSSVSESSSTDAATKEPATESTRKETTMEPASEETQGTTAENVSDEPKHETEPGNTDTGDSKSSANDKRMTSEAIGISLVGAISKYWSWVSPLLRRTTSMATRPTSVQMTAVT